MTTNATKLPGITGKAADLLKLCPRARRTNRDYHEVQRIRRVLERAGDQIVTLVPQFATPRTPEEAHHGH